MHIWRADVNEECLQENAQIACDWLQRDPLARPTSSKNISAEKMSPSVFFEIFFFLLSTFPLVHSAATNNPEHSLSEWTRTFDSQVTRVNSRLDQLMVRMDHLDSRVGRIQSLVQMRFDNIENGLTTTKLRMDLWGDDLSRIEEQLTRKWKTFETKFDALVGNVEAKLESKLNSIQRDNRRHSEFLTSSFANVVQGQDKLTLSLHDMNSTVGRIGKTLQQKKNGSEGEVAKSGSNNQTNYVLLSNKVTNMFDDLLRKSVTIEGSLKDSIAISNATRRDVHDGLRSLISNQRSNNPRLPASSSSSETMSAVIMEALASVEALSIRINSLGRSIDERFEIVSMALNGFLDSCLRIQDGESVMEERIAHVLDKLLDNLDNSTRTATQMWLNVTTQLLQEKGLRVNCTNSGDDDTLSRDDYEEGGGGGNGVNVEIENYARELLERSGDMTEEDKKSLWDSLFPVPE